MNGFRPAPVSPPSEPPLTGDPAHAPDTPVSAAASGHDTRPDTSLGGGITIAVVDPAEVVRAALRDHVRGLHVEVALYVSVSALVQETGRREPVVIVLGPSVSPQLLIEQLDPLLKARADRGAVMVVHPLSPEMVRSAFRAGVDDVVTADAADTELLGAIIRSASRIRAVSEATRPPAMTSATPLPASHRRVVAVFGTKGGVGKSVVAVNLAVALARQTVQPTVLVDANLQFGDAAIMLQLPPTHTITEVGLAGDRVDGDLLDGLLLRHEPSGLLLLAAPPSPEAADQIGRSDLANVITVLRERCAYVVIDTSPRIEESTLAALEAADDILLLTNLDVTSLKDARLALQTLHALGIQEARVRLVLNRANTQGGLTRADVGRSVRMKVTTALPSDPLVVDSINRGMPMMLSAPTSKFTLSIDDLARALRARSSATSA